jgi:hypothetical protein
MIRERRDVAQGEVEALRRDRVQTQRRVPDQERALTRELLARDARERVRAPFADPRDAAEPKTECRLQLRTELVDGQRELALGVLARQRPNDRSPATGQRQERDRAALREALERSTRERRLRRHIEDQRALLVVVSTAAT